jgi:hypothetical protein
MRRRALSERLCKFADSSGAGTYALSQVCVSAVLSGKHVERAPPCRNRASTCQPWEREWNGKKLDAADVVGSVRQRSIVLREGMPGSLAILFSVSPAAMRSRPAARHSIVVPGAGGAIGARESRKLRRMAIPCYGAPALWQ